MPVRNNTKTLLMTFGAALALSACGGGADSVVSPGEGAFPPAPPPTTPPPTTPPTPPPPTSPPPAAGPAENCPTGFANVGTVAGGTLRACQLPNRIVGNLVIKKLDGVIYAINGQVNVGDDAGGNASAPVAGAQTGILTVEPGVRFFGSAGADFLVVNRGSQIFAEGTASDPIVFTSRASVPALLPARRANSRRCRLRAGSSNKAASTCCRLAGNSRSIVACVLLIRQRLWPLGQRLTSGGHRAHAACVADSEPKRPWVGVESARAAIKSGVSF